MGNGRILHKKTDCKLSAADMQFIGVRAVNVDLFATGMEWLYHAYQKVLNGDDSLPKVVIQNYLMTARKLVLTCLKMICVLLFLLKSENKFI